MMVARMSGSSQLSRKVSLSLDVSGVLYVTGFLAMATGNAVYTGNLLQDLHPFTFLFWSFLATAITFLVTGINTKMLGGQRCVRQSRPIAAIGALRNEG